MLKVLPQDTAAKVLELQAGGAPVATVGDGVIDATAVAAADLGLVLSARPSRSGRLQEPTSTMRGNRGEGRVMRKTRIVAASVAAVLTAGVVSMSASAGDTAGAKAATGVDPSQFTNPKPNPYFPLNPGTVSRYRGSEDGKQLRERLTVTHAKKTIQGVETTVVRDVIRRPDGTLAEKTHDWYAPDNVGNVWYFGEATATYGKDGKLKSREGSWQAGVRGAVAGLIMPADPKPTKAYRQEFYPNHAEDQGWIVQAHGTVTVPFGTFHHVVRSFEWTRLEPDVIAVKFYAPGLGIIREKDVLGGTEVLELVSVTRG